MQENVMDEFYIPDQELKIIGELNNASALYLVFGGYAVLFYGYEDRQVNDLDIWVNNDKENAEKVYKALNGLPGININFTSDKLLNTNQKIELPSYMYEVELFTSVTGVDFGFAYSHKVSASVKGQNIDIVSIEDLLTIKRYALQESKERAQKEIADIEFLESKIHA